MTLGRDGTGHVHEEEGHVAVDDPVDRILAQHGLRGPGIPLEATGLANRVYATPDVVLRIATDHPDAVEDARTESVAAPVARAAGLLVPRLIVFDDSRTLVDRPYSIWERMGGAALGLLPVGPRESADAWRAVGRQLAWLHERVRECPDPHGWLDRPDRERGLESRLAELVSRSRIDAVTANEIQAWIERLKPAASAPAAQRFLHNDVHEMNVMCTPQGVLTAVIDWGDAGWGDPALELAQVPLHAVPFVLSGYEQESSDGLGGVPAARIVWDKIERAMETGTDALGQLAELRRFVRDGDPRWRRVS